MANRTARISQERQQMMVDLYQQGVPRRQVAERMDSSIETVNKILREHGIQEFRPHYSHKILPAQFPIVVARYRDGEQIEAIAESYGCTGTIIRRILDRYAVERRDDRGRRREYTPDEIEQIRRLASEGQSQNQIALALGSAQTTISKLMKKEGMSPAKTGAQTRESHYRWIGGRTKHPSGYWQIRLDPSDPLFCMTNRMGCVMEHRLVMARKHGRPLAAHETVHHIDGDRANNDPENLQLRQGQHGSGAAFVCADCDSHNIVSTGIKEA